MSSAATLHNSIENRRKSSIIQKNLLNLIWMRFSMIHKRIITAWLENSFRRSSWVHIWDKEKELTTAHLMEALQRKNGTRQNSGTVTTNMINTMKILKLILQMNSKRNCNISKRRKVRKSTKESFTTDFNMRKLRYVSMMNIELRWKLHLLKKQLEGQTSRGRRHLVL